MKNYTHLVPTCIWLFFLFLPQGYSQAQTSILEGTIVLSKSDSLITKCQITVKGNGWEKTTKSDSSHNFKFNGLPRGLCNLTISNNRDESSMVIHELYLSPVKPLLLVIPLESSFFLDEATVTADAFRTTSETPLSLKSINWAEMQRMPGATLDLSKAIQSFPGVLPKSSFGYNISIRGGSSSENVYRMDGIDIPTINHFSIQGASGGAVSLINMDFIENVELYSGAFPSSMSNALSGALNIELRTSRTDRFGSRVTLGATDYGASLEIPMGRKTNLMISGRNSFSQHYFKLFSIPVLPTYQDAQLRLHHQISKSQDLTIIGIGGWDKYELFIKPLDKSSESLLYNIGYIPEGNQSTRVLGGRYRKYLQNGLKTLTLSTDFITNNADKFIGNDSEGDRQLKYESSEQKIRLRYERLWNFDENRNLSFGLNIDGIQWGFDSWSLKGQPSGIDTAILKSNDFIIQTGVFITYNQRVLNNRGDLNIGLRTDISNYNLDMINPLSQLAPRASFKYQLSSKWTWNTHIGRYTKLPPSILMAANRSSNRSSFTHFTLADHLGTGIEFQSGKTYRVSMELYRKNYRRAPFLENDQIAFANSIGTYVAIGDQPSSSNALGRSYGFEIFLQQKLKRNYWWMAAYNFGRSEYLSENNKWAPSIWDSRHTVSITNGYTWGKGWQIGAKWRFSSGTPYTPFDRSSSSLVSNWDILQRGIFDYSIVNSERLAPFTQLDLRLDKTYANEKWSFSWFLDLSNIASGNIPLMPYLTVERDSNLQPVLQSGDPSRYRMQLLESDTGRVLPTIGMIFDF